MGFRAVLPTAMGTKWDSPLVKAVLHLQMGFHAILPIGMGAKWDFPLFTGLRLKYHANGISCKIPFIKWDFPFSIGSSLPVPTS